MSPADPVAALRKRVTLEEPARASDGAGGGAITYVNRGEVWAEIRALRGRESVIADALSSVVAHEARIRFREDVAPGWRLVFEGRALRVRHVRDERGERRWLTLDCEEELRS